MSRRSDGGNSLIRLASGDRREAVNSRELTASLFAGGDGVLKHTLGRQVARTDGSSVAASTSLTPIGLTPNAVADAALRATVAGTFLKLTPRNVAPWTATMSAGSALTWVQPAGTTSRTR